MRMCNYLGCKVSLADFISLMAIEKKNVLNHNMLISSLQKSLNSTQLRPKTTHL
jgi:hypothetical protein